MRSKQVFEAIRDRDLIRESKREELDHYLKIKHLRDYRRIKETTKLKTT